jgi:hypothetical protein
MFSTTGYWGTLSSDEPIWFLGLEGGKRWLSGEVPV